MINGEIKKAYRINEQQAKEEWLYRFETLAKFIQMTVRATRIDRGKTKKN